MKNRVKKEPKGPDEYRYLRNKLLLRAVLSFLAVALALVLLYYNLLVGTGVFSGVAHFILRMIFFGNEAIVGRIYYILFFQNRDLSFALGVLAAFFILACVYIRGFVRYFKDINRGMDCLLEDDDTEAKLVPELEAVERKLNLAKRTIRRQRWELMEAEQRKNDLIMYLAHDLKTPLASVIGYLTLLRDESDVPPELREKYLAITLGKAERLEELINELFEITRFNLSHIELTMGDIDLTRLLEQLVYEFRPMLRDKELTCVLDVPERLPLRCDADKLQRVFDNLLRNAVLYSNPGTEIDVAAGSDGEWVTVTVTNQGGTIPPEKLERIFEQFYRLDASRSTATGGAGLGLAIARQIVELHGGTVTAKSDGGRTRFTVRLPV